MLKSPTSVMGFGKTLLDGFGRLVYPNTCWVCGEFIPTRHRQVCVSCCRQVKRDPFRSCPRCSGSVGPYIDLKDGCAECRSESYRFDRVFRMAPYDGLLREVILRMKHPGGEGLAEVIGASWAKKMARRLAPLEPHYVIPVPLHWARQWQRGFNQSAILAECLAHKLGIPCVPGALRRVKRTQEQKRQPSAKARTDNVRAAFACTPTVSLRDKTLLLVDDVLTSGATASESASALRTQRPRAIFVVVLAHGK